MQVEKDNQKRNRLRRCHARALKGGGGIANTCFSWSFKLGSLKYKHMETLKNLRRKIDVLNFVSSMVT